MERNFSVSKYVWLFVATNVAGILLLSVTIAILNIDPGSAPSIVIFFMATAVPAHAFVKDHDRVPSKVERTRLVRWSFLAYVVLSVALVAALVALPGPLLPEPLPEEAGMGSLALIFSIVATFAALLCYGLLVLGYKVFSKQALKALEKQAEVEAQKSK